MSETSVTIIINNCFQEIKHGPEFRLKGVKTGITFFLPPALEMKNVLKLRLISIWVLLQSRNTLLLWCITKMLLVILYFKITCIVIKKRKPIG